MCDQDTLIEQLPLLYIHPKYSNRRVTVQAAQQLSNHPIEGSAEVKSTIRWFSYIQVTDQTVQLKTGHSINSSAKVT